MSIETSFWERATNYVSAALLAVVLWVWRETIGRIREAEAAIAKKADANSTADMFRVLGEDLHKLRNRVVSHDEFKAYADRSEISRKELRDATITLARSTEAIGQAVARIEGKIAK